MARRSHAHRWMLTAALIASLPALAAAGDWPRFRGLGGAGQGDAPSLPVEIDQSHFRWELDLPGAGHSSPVVRGGALYVTASDGRRWSLLCIDAETGEVQWQRDRSADAYGKHRFNSFATGTPAVDADGVYTCRFHDGRYRVTAWSHEGQERWSRELGPLDAQHGAGISPIVYNGKLILRHEHRAEPSFVIALDTGTGQTVWKTPRNPTGNTAYGTPLIHTTDDGRDLLIAASTGHGIYALAPETGKPLWDFPDLFEQRNVSSPVVAGGLLFASTGVGGNGDFLAAIRPDAAETGGEAQLAYRIDRAAPYVPTPVAHGELLFAIHDGGVATCIHAPSGEVKWRSRLDGNFFSSPINVNSRIYLISRSGELIVFPATDEGLDVLHRFDFGQTTHATPAVANGRMYVRTTERLICIAPER